MKKLIFILICAAAFFALCFMAEGETHYAYSNDPDESSLTILYAGVCVATMVLGPCFRPVAMIISFAIGASISAFLFGVEAFVTYGICMLIISTTVYFEPEIRKMVSCLWTDDEE